MNPVDTIGALAHEVVRDRIDLGRQSRLAALARCCQPHAWGRALRGAIVAAHRLGRRRAPGPSVCCT